MQLFLLSINLSLSFWALIVPAENNQAIKRQEDTYLTLEEINALRYVTQIFTSIQLNIQDLKESVTYHPNQYFKLQMGLRVGLEIDSNEQPI